MRKFWFDGRCCTDFGMIPSGAGTYNAPERDVEIISVEGRSGDLIRDNGRFKNVTVSYPVSICRDFPEKAAAARGWLLSKAGYRRLEDDYAPDYFRLAMFKGPVNFDVKFLNRAAEATLSFNCKPQRYLKTGEYAMPLAAPGVLRNPTGFPALPRITLYGTGAGELTVGGVTVQVKSMTDHLILDSETQNAFQVADSGAYVNQNANIYAPEFPVLAEGETTVSWSGDITKIEIIPRWWTL